jgi:Zn-dependent proteases
MFSPSPDSAFRGDTNDNIELLKAWIGTSLAFGLFSNGGQLDGELFTQMLPLALFTCGLGVLLHELAHRVVARYYGAQAHFLANNNWLILSIVIAFMGVFVAAPGAVWHRGYLTKQQSGLIALAGPATNFVLVIVFMIILFASILLGAPDWLYMLAIMGYGINSWLGLFNMIPFGPFDGAKVLNWSPIPFGIAALIGVALVFGRSQIFGFILQFLS